MEPAPPILVDRCVCVCVCVCERERERDESHPGGLDSEESAYSVGNGGSLLGKNLLEKLPTWVWLPGNGYPLQYSCLEKSMDRGAWRVTLHGVANSLSTTE